MYPEIQIFGCGGYLSAIHAGKFHHFFPVLFSWAAVYHAKSRTWQIELRVPVFIIMMIVNVITIGRGDIFQKTKRHIGIPGALSLHQNDELVPLIIPMLYIESQIIADLRFERLSCFQGNHFNAISRNLPLCKITVKSPQIIRILKKAVKTYVEKIDLAKLINTVRFILVLSFAVLQNYLNIIWQIFKKFFVKFFHAFYPLQLLTAFIIKAAARL